MNTKPINKSGQQTVPEIQVTQEENEIVDNGEEIQVNPIEYATNLNDLATMNKILQKNVDIMNLSDEESKGVTDNPSDKESKGVTDNPSDEESKGVMDNPSDEESKGVTDNPSDKESKGVTDNPSDEESKGVTDNPSDEESKGVTDNPSDDASINDEPSQKETANLDDESNQIMDSSEVAENGCDQLINQQGSDNLKKVLTLTSYGTKLGYLGDMFQCSIGLYPMIIYALRKEDRFKDDIDITISFNSWLYYGALCGVCATTFDCIFERSRKLFFYLSGILSLLGFFIMMLAPNYQYLLAGRFTVGIGMGLHAVTFYCYLYECFIGLKQMNIFFDKIRTLSYQANTKELLLRALFIMILRSSSWNDIISCILHINLLVLVSIEIIESPYILLRKGEIDRAREAVNQLIEMDAAETGQCDLTIEKENGMLRILSLLYPSGIPQPDSTFYLASSFVIHEFLGITIMYIYMISVAGNEEIYLTIAVLAESVLFIWSKWMPSMEEEHFNGMLSNSSFKMGVCTLILGLLTMVQYYVENFAQFPIGDILIFNIIKLFILYCYFKTYATGLMYGDHILFNVRETYSKFKKIAITALLCKYIAVIILIQLYCLSNWVVSLSLTAYSAISLSYSLGLSKASN